MFRFGGPTLNVEKSLPDNWRDEAYMANHAYNQENLEGYSTDKDLSNEYQTTYVKDGKATVAFSGTDFSKPGKMIHDLNADLEIVQGTQEMDPTFSAALEAVRKAQSKYGIKNVYATGHSLGGTKALYASHKLGVKATAFNPGWSPMAVAQSGYMTPWNLRNAHAFVVPGDPLSASAFLQPGLRTHKIANKEKLHKLKHDLTAPFALKPFETTAGVSVSDAINAIPEVGPLINLGLKAKTAAQMFTSVGGDFAALHDSHNFLLGRKRQGNPVVSVAVSKPKPSPTPPSVVQPSNLSAYLTYDGIHSTPNYGVPQSQAGLFHFGPG